MKLWDKGTSPNKAFEAFTVGKDRELDLYLAPYDILGSLAHAHMLQKIGLLSEDEHRLLAEALRGIHEDIAEGHFSIEEGVEDVHSQIEFLLTKKLGETGKKIHSGRSRNDQVLVALKLFFVDQIRELVEESERLFGVLQGQSEKHKSTLLPGYTHTQVAMPSSFGLWFGAYAESLVEDLHLLLATFRVVDQNPLGSAAGYGSSFPLDRGLSTRLLGFSTLSYNVVHAQMGRGKTERIFSMALSSLAATLNRLASDVCLYMSQNFGFLSLPESWTTGSSIMPHKKNPDGFEILRARSNKLQGLGQQLQLLTTNLTSGYHRDLQMSKELLLPAIFETKECLQMCRLMVERLIPSQDLLDQDIYRYLFSVEVVNRYVLEEMSFREAYKKVGKEIQEGRFEAPSKLKHSHEGSLGMLCTEEIKGKWQEVRVQFRFDEFRQAWKKLVE